MKQTQGVLEALAEITSIEIKEIAVPHLPFLVELNKHIQYFFTPQRLAEKNIKNVDLIIGTGSRTHIPMLACKKIYDTPTITCMSPSTLLRKKFDLCFIPYHDNVQEASNVFRTIGPPNRSRAKNRQDKSKALILIGGLDPKSHHWNNLKTIAMVDELLKRESHLTWTISSSPRTPPETIKSLENLCNNFNNSNFVEFKDTPAGWIEEQYDLSHYVWVTADSMSMIYESLSAGCQVGIIPVYWRNKKNKFIQSEQKLITDKIVLSYEDWLNGKKHITHAQSLNEAKRCAQEILKRWWPNRLQ